MLKHTKAMFMVESVFREDNIEKANIHRKKTIIPRFMYENLFIYNVTKIAIYRNQVEVVIFGSYSRDSIY